MPLHSSQGQVALYFGLVALLTLPFWLAGFLLPARLLPGLSISAFAVMVPTTAATLAAGMTGRWPAIRSLFASLARDAHKRGVILAAAILMPLVAAILSWAMTQPASSGFPGFGALAALVPLFVAAAIAEDLGWSAFAACRLAGRAGATGAGLFVGVPWALWHVPALVAIERPADWIGWWSAWAIAQRVVMTHLYLRGGSWIWGPVLFHAVSNIAWQAVPDAFDPRIEAVVMGAIALVVIGSARGGARLARKPE